MKIWNVRLTKKRVVLGVIISGALVCALLSALGGEPEEACEELLLDTNQARLEYLSQWGWEVEPEPLETLQFLMGQTLEEPYLSYNVLQRSQGFDLETCLGKPLERYTDAVTNYPGGREGVQVNLYVCEGQPAGGDVCCPGANGFRNPLAYPGETGE